MRRKFATLTRHGFPRKLEFSKKQAFYNGSAGVVFVVDTEGKHPAKIKELKLARDSYLPGFPTAVGVAHPCIEAWLLSDPRAVRLALNRSKDPEFPESPEALPAPCDHPTDNPKSVLARSHVSKAALSAEETDRIAGRIRNLQVVRDKCPLSFGPFAVEVEERIKPLFASGAALA